jgi:hypothetical protein
MLFQLNRMFASHQKNTLDWIYGPPIGKDFIRSLVESDPALWEFVMQNWGCVHQAASVWHLQPVDPEISPLLLYVTRRVNRQAKAEDR